MSGEQHSIMVCILASEPSCPKFDSPQKELLRLLRLINGAAQRKVNSGLKMLIEPI